MNILSPFETAAWLGREVVRELGGVGVEAVKDIGSAFVPDFLKGREDSQSKQSAPGGGDTYIDITIECPYENDDCEKCGDCGREDLEDIEDFEE